MSREMFPSIPESLCCSVWSSNRVPAGCWVGPAYGKTTPGSRTRWGGDPQWTRMRWPDRLRSPASSPVLSKAPEDSDREQLPAPAAQKRLNWRTQTFWPQTIRFQVDATETGKVEPKMKVNIYSTSCQFKPVLQNPKEDIMKKVGNRTA